MNTSARTAVDGLKTIAYSESEGIPQLTAAYMNGTDSPYGTWTVLGVGVRMAQDVGAHRKKTYGSTPTVEDELWRRAFCCRIEPNRARSGSWLRWTGLPALGWGGHAQYMKKNPMTECDDEYWTPADPTLAFKQPPDRPSKIAFFNCLGRLLRILAFASRTIYTTNKSKLLFGFVGPEWKQGVVAELDSALNEWLDSVPEHLRWDPNMQDPTFFNQSATLYANYYQAQICIHRQFLPSRRKPSLASLPSLAICTSAARSCVSVLYAQHLRTGLTKCTLCSMLVPLNTAALILVIALSASKANGREREVEAIADEIGKCFEMLLSMEPYHQGIGKFRAALHGLLVAERPTTSSTRTAGSSAPSNEPRFFGADDLGGLVVAMMNNLSLSSPQADLEDVGPFWGHPAEAPFYGPKPKFSVQHPADAESISEPPGAQMQREASTEELQVQAASVHRDGARPIVSPPSYANSGAVPVAHTPGMPTFEIPLSPPLSLDITDEGSIDFTPFFVENERLGLGMSVPRDPYAAPSTMLPVARSDWDTFL
ncbi:hypothetical protein C8T65DRAFT_698033 [Cerioporus squamosus]|nr:hypothetical protein C8T65DRAFT_698033 [Cerioporus squamosus]